MTGDSSGPGPDDLAATGTAETMAALLIQLAVQPTLAPQVTDTSAPPTETSLPPVADTPVPALATPTAACTDVITFVADVTVPDDTYLPPGEVFTKTWRLRNAGTCTWTTDYAVVFSSGQRMDGPDGQYLAEAVPPGSNVDISVLLTSPVDTGT